jgi:hypothetical protein
LIRSLFRYLNTRYSPNNAPEPLFFFFTEIGQS